MVCWLYALGWILALHTAARTDDDLAVELNYYSVTKVVGKDFSLKEEIELQRPLPQNIRPAIVAFTKCRVGTTTQFEIQTNNTTCAVTVTLEATEADGKVLSYDFRISNVTNQGLHNECSCSQSKTFLDFDKKQIYDHGYSLADGKLCREWITVLVTTKANVERRKREREMEKKRVPCSKVMNRDLQTADATVR